MKNLLILPLVFCFLHSALTAQALEAQYDYADSLFTAGSYFDAVTEFKRLVFFDSAGEYNYEAYTKIAESYKAGAFYSNALLYFTRAEMAAETVTERYRSSIEKVRIYILTRNITFAYNKLNDIEKDFPDKRFELDYWRGWTAVFDDDFGYAAEWFEAAGDSEYLKNFCREVESEKYSVTLARVLSVVLPGAGQFYTGNYVSGILSLGWHALLGWMTFDALFAKRYFDGAMIGNFLWLRFFRGNIQNAVKFAERENEIIVNKALNFLQNNYKGEKP